VPHVSRGLRDVGILILGQAPSPPILFFDGADNIFISGELGEGDLGACPHNLER